MRFFLSYARQDVAIAESLATRARAIGLDVEIDLTMLHAGKEYDESIRKRIHDSDGFIFLASASSLEPGGYALAELAIAENRWRRPSGRVLPVLLGSTTVEELPASLRAVTVLRPKGDVVAETIAVLAELRDQRRRRRTKAIACGLVLGIALSAPFWWPQPDIPIDAPIEVAKMEAERRVAAFHREGDLLEVQITLKNASSVTRGLEELELQLDLPDEDLYIDVGGFYPSAQLPPRKSKQLVWPVIPFLGGEGERIRERDLRSTRWRLVWDENGKPFVGPWQPWTVEGAAMRQVSPLKDVPDGASFLAVTPQGFAVGTNAGVVMTLSEDGRPTGLQVDLGAPLTSLDCTGQTLLIGMREPDQVMELNAQSLAQVGAATIPSREFEGWGNSSTRVRSALRAHSGVWVVTGAQEDDAQPDLLFAMNLQDGFQSHPMIDGMERDVNGCILVGSGSSVWAVGIDMTPGSLHFITPNSFVSFGGHDFEELSCCDSAVGWGGAGDLITLDCENNAQVVRAEGTALERARIWPTAIDDQTSPDSNEREHLALRGDTLWCAMSTLRSSDQQPLRLRLWRFDLETAAESLVIDLEGVAVEAFAVGPKSILALVRRDDGERAVVVFDPTIAR